MKLQIDYGYKTYDIEDSEGNVVGSIRFNPSDMGMVGRWNEAQKRIEEMLSGNINTPEEVYKADCFVKDQLDYIFAAPVAEVLFAGQSAVSIRADGSMLLESVLEALAPIIQDAQQAAGKASAQRMANHTAKYQNTTRGMAPGQV